MGETAANSQAEVLELIVKSLEKSLQERDLEGLAGLFRHGAAMTQRMQEGAEGPLHPEWT